MGFNDSVLFCLVPAFESQQKVCFHVRVSLFSVSSDPPDGKENVNKGQCLHNPPQHHPFLSEERLNLGANKFFKKHPRPPSFSQSLLDSAQGRLRQPVGSGGGLSKGRNSNRDFPSKDKVGANRRSSCELGTLRVPGAAGEGRAVPLAEKAPTFTRL